MLLGNHNASLPESSHVFREFMTADLENFKSAGEKYVALEAARSVIQTLVNGDSHSNTLPPSQQAVTAKFKSVSNALFSEIFEFQKEISRNELVHEKMQLMNNDMTGQVSKPQTCTNDVLALKVQIEQTEVLLRGLTNKKNVLDDQIIESEKLKAQADNELTEAKQRQRIAETTVAARRIIADSAPTSQTLTSTCINLKNDIQRFQTQKADLEALMAGLEALFQLKLQAVGVTSGNGVQITTVINGTHTFVFELDDKKKLVDIHMAELPVDSSAEPGAEAADVCCVDPLRLLCDCAQLPPPLDLRHALLASSAALRREQALRQHLKQSSIKKLCLLQRHKGDSRVVDVTFRNGISAVLKIHECYPNVPNGVHVEVLTSVGGWSDEELRAARPTINSRCLQTLPDMVLHLIETFSD